MSEEKIELAEKLMESLAESNDTFMGLCSRGEGILDTLLWLLADGEPLEELQDLDEGL